MDERNDKKYPKENDAMLKEVTTVQGPVEAEVVKSLLQSHGITCILKGLVVQSVHAFSANGLGEIKIMVAKKDYETARQLIRNQSASQT